MKWNSTIALSLAPIIGVVLLGYFTAQQDFPKILLGYGLMWIFYLVVIKNKGWNYIPQLIVLGILLRLILLPVFPPLSDDYFRFIWDGYQNLDGISPYLEKPENFIGNATTENYQKIYEELNSKTYYSVYPPLLQSIFTFSTWLFPKSLLGVIITMRFFLILFEIGSIFLISKILGQFSLPKWQVLLYALNPLVIMEISGNLHFEGMMIFFLLSSIYLLGKYKNIIPAAISLGLAIGTKILPLIFIPFYLHKLGFKKALLFGITAGITSILSFFMLWDINLLQNFRESVKLYYQSFEFNGGIYYVFREIGFLFRGYNEINILGPSMALISATFIIILALRDTSKNISRLAILFLIALSFYQLFSTTVHPWYIAPLVALSSLCNFRFAILWSGLILLTYINYSYEPYFENKWIVALEFFAIIGFLVYEIMQGKFTDNNVSLEDKSIHHVEENT